MLSTPPAFILSQDQTLVKNVCIRVRIAWQFCSCLLFWFDIFRCPFLKNLFKEFSGFVVYCSVINVLFCCCRFMRQLLYYIKVFHVCQQLFISFLLLWSSPSRDSSNRIAYSSRLVNSFFIFHPLCLCMPLLSLCLDQRTNVILPRLSWIVNVVFIFCAIQNILTFLCFSSVFRLSKLFPCSPESESLKAFNFYNFVIAIIPGSKGQKADASLLARGFLTSWPAKNMSK